MAGKGKSKRGRKITLAAGANGDIELIRVEVDDPYEAGAKLRVMKNVRVHPLDSMLARNRISQAQFEAGETFLKLFEQAEIGNVQAIDYQRVKVDVSYVHRGLDAVSMAAAKRLMAIRSAIGRRPYELLAKVVGERASPYSLAMGAPGGASDRMVWHVFQAVREALDDVAECFGVAHGPASSPIRAASMEGVDLTSRGSGAMK